MGEIVQGLLDRGRAEGRAEGLAKALMKLLKHRFGALPGRVRRRIAEASLGQLDVWFTAALSGQSLAEVLESPASDWAARCGVQRPSGRAASPVMASAASA